MLRFIIWDSDTNRTTHIDDIGSLYTAINPSPIPNIPDLKSIFRQYFTDNGTETGSNIMNIDGSVTPVSFYIEADEINDRFIKTISFVVSDDKATLSNFGNINPLTNGVKIFYDNSSTKTNFTKKPIVIHNAIKSNFDLVRLCQGNPSFGSSVFSFRLDNIMGPSEGYIPTLDFSIIFGYQWGIRLKGGTSQKLVIQINDDLTGIDMFDAIAYGFNRLTN